MQCECEVIHGEANAGLLCRAHAEAIIKVAVAEREACAKTIEGITMGDLLLSLGEMTAQERRTCKALLSWLAHRVRTRDDWEPAPTQLPKR